MMRPLTLSEAAALERITYQAFSGGRAQLFSTRGEPFGGSDSELDTYGEAAMRDWGSLCRRSARSSLQLACPWMEPSHVRISNESPSDGRLSRGKIFFVAEKRGLRGVREARAPDGHLIQPAAVCAVSRSAPRAISVTSCVSSRVIAACLFLITISFV